MLSNVYHRLIMHDTIEDLSFRHTLSINDVNLSANENMIPIDILYDKENWSERITLRSAAHRKIAKIIEKLSTQNNGIDSNQKYVEDDWSYNQPLIFDGILPKLQTDLYNSVAKLIGYPERSRGDLLTLGSDSIFNLELSRKVQSKNPLN